MRGGGSPQTLPAPALSFEYALALSFLIAEMLGIVTAALSLLFLTRTRDRSPDADANAGWLASLAECPPIDVLICSYNEDREILERTIVGALAMDYPSFRVWMLDDSRRDWVKTLCAELGCHYLSRSDNAHAKAGNINHALKQIAALPVRPEFVSILDADFVPTPHFLTRAMSLFRDPAIGVVQTPQHFINPDPIQINLGATKFWPDEQRYFFDIVLPAKDAWSAAFCCGTSSIIRMQPLMEIDGFPVNSVTEDYLLSLRLKEKGFSTAYLNEPLTYGLAPEGLKEYITQRSRWCLGFMQIARGRSGPLSTRSPLALIDRLSLTEVFLNWTTVPLSRAIGLIVPPISLAFSLNPFQASLYDIAIHFLPYWLWCGLMMHWLSGGRILPILFDVSQIIVAPQLLKAVLFGLARPQGQKFQVTAKGGDRNRGFVEWTVMRPFLVPDRCVDRRRSLGLLRQQRSERDSLFEPCAGLDLVQSGRSLRALLCLRRAASQTHRRAVRVARTGFRENARSHPAHAARRLLDHRRAHLWSVPGCVRGDDRSGAAELSRFGEDRSR